MSSLTNIGNGDSSHTDSGLIANNGSSYLLRKMSLTLKYVLSSYAYWLFTSMFPRNHGSHDEVNTTTSSRDVEVGGIPVQTQANNGLQSQADFSSHIAHPTLTYIQLVENQILAEAASRRDPTRDVSGEHVSNPQPIGVKAVGNGIIPTVIGVIGCLIQVVVEDKKVKSDQKILLNLCFGASLATLFLGLILFILSIMPRNNPSRVLIIKFLVIVAFGSAFVDLCLLITFGFVVMHSRAH